MRFAMFVVGVACGALVNSGIADDVPPVVPAPVGAPLPSAAESPQPGESTAHTANQPPELPAEGLQPNALVPRAGTSDRLRPPEHSASNELLSRKEAELECLQEEVDRLREQTGQARSVMVRLIAFEFSRATLGNRAQELDALLGLRPDVSQLSEERSPFVKAHESHEGASAFVRPASFDRPEAPLRALGVSLVDGDLHHSPLFKRLNDAGLIKVLAEPTLTSSNSRPASFLVGGQFPVPMQDSNGGSCVTMMPFGVQLHYVPAVRPGRRIRLDLAFELSDRDFKQRLEIAGVEVPGLVGRRVNTQIELKSGQTAVISRLTQRRPLNSGDAIEAERTAESQRAQSDDYEMIVLVTPELLHDAETPSPMRLRSPVPDPEAAASAYHPSEEYQYYPAMPVLPRGLRR